MTLIENYEMLMLIQSLIFGVNVYFPESTQARPDTRQHIILKIWSVIFWQGPAPHDLWWCSDFTSCCVVRDWEPRDHNITCNLLNTNITQTSFTNYRAQQIKESTWPSTFGQKQRGDTETGDNFKKVFFRDFRSRYEEYDQIMQRMNRSIIHIK